MKDKKPDSYSDIQWEQFKVLRDEFIEVLKGQDEDQINQILNDHPDNQIPEDDNNDRRTAIDWNGCPLRATASYYANDRMEITKMPVYEADEILDMINGKA